MSGILKIYKEKATVKLSTTATALATVTGTVHYMTTSNPQIIAGQTLSVHQTIKVLSVVSESYNGARRSKVTLNGSLTINANTALTFTSNDNTFSTEGRVGEVSNFKITVDRITGSILSPKPTLNFSDVYSISSYKVVSSDTFENTTELIRREYNVTYVVPLKKSYNKDILNLKVSTIIDETGVNNQIFGYELLTNPPGQNIESLTVKKSSFLKDLTSISFPSKRNINKKAETRLLVVYGDPGVTFKLGVVSNVIPVTSNSSAQTNQTTLSMGNGSNTAVAKINKGMTITSTTSSSVSAGLKVKSTSGTNVVVSTAQSLAANEQISFGHVLVAANTIKTIDENGIHAEYVTFPKNISTANITFTITLTQHSNFSFIGFDSPETLSIVSLAVPIAVPAYVTSTDRRTTSSNQQPSTSVVSTGSGTVVNNYATTNNTNLGF
tara:strand:- start:13479 stop:14795 length:1317 start_codon:yes stop_codon:yes gene_type:complete